MNRLSPFIPLASVGLSLAFGALASPGQTVADEEVEAQQQPQYHELDHYFDRWLKPAAPARAK